jgi:hypothetical protein
MNPTRQWQVTCVTPLLEVFSLEGDNRCHLRGVIYTQRTSVLEDGAELRRQEPCLLFCKQGEGLQISP